MRLNAMQTGSRGSVQNMSKDKNEKYALLTYNTVNIGDYIQSIAARRFLPRVDYYIDRDTIGNWVNGKNETVKLITNGWYMDAPYAWPISDTTLKPLYISMYVEQTDQHVRNKFLSAKSRSNFNKFGKIGARDIASQDFFAQNSIDSYLSGCLTLTLQKDSNIKKGEFILLTDVSYEVYQYVLGKTKRKVIYLTNLMYAYAKQEEKDELAEIYLYLYQSAHCVITERLHTALPCLALETPVLLLKKEIPAGGNKNRLAGLSSLVFHFTEREFLSQNAYDINKPPLNSNKYLDYRNKLVKTCSDFTEYDNKKTFSWTNISNKSLNQVLQRLQFMNASIQNISNLELYRALRLNENLNVRISHLEKNARDLEKVIANNNVELDRLKTIKGSARRLAGNIKRKISKTDE